MAKTTTSQKHAQLKSKAADAKRNVFDMLRLADEILADHDYVQTLGGEGKLLEMLEQDEFSHFGGKPDLPSMLRAYRANPKFATWQEYNCNVQVMIDLATPARESTDRPYTNWKAQCAELTERVKSLESQLGESRELNTALRNDLKSSTETIGELRGQLKMLRGHQLVA